MGVVWPDPENDGRLRVYFESADRALRSISPQRLPEHETVYAMSIHKSQGSEFGRVLMILPDRESRIVTNELIYTGITRARKQVEIWGVKDLFLRGVTRRITSPGAVR